MNDHDLIAFVMGDASPEIARAIEGHAAIDPEFAAEVEVLRSLGGAPTTRMVAAPKRRRFRIRKSILVLGALVLTASAAYAGYVLTRTPPLLADNFSSNTVSFKNWERQLGRPGIRVDKGCLRLLNRGSVVTAREFNEPLEIEFDWKWIDLGDHPHYADTFHVVLQTQGHHDEDHPFQIRDGVNIVFNCVSHAVHVSTIGTDFDVKSSPDTTPFPSDSWHHVRIVDDGVSISIFITGPSIDERFTKEPVIVATPPSRPKGHRIAFFNREYVAGVNHESQIDNLVVRPWKRGE